MCPSDVTQIILLCVKKLRVDDGGSGCRVVLVDMMCRDSLSQVVVDTTNRSLVPILSLGERNQQPYDDHTTMGQRRQYRHFSGESPK